MHRRTNRPAAGWRPALADVGVTMMSTSIHPERGSAILDASRTANASPAFPRDTDKTRIRPVRVLRGSDLDVGRLASLGSILILMIVGGIPRLADLDRLPLRIDEVYTLLYLRQSWSAVLGLGGYYDFHPPLFFAMGKAAAVVVPEEIASRSVAALAGLLTIPLFYALVKHVLDRVAALIATLVLAIAP